MLSQQKDQNDTSILLKSMDSGLNKALYTYIFTSQLVKQCIVSMKEKSEWKNSNKTSI